MSLKFEGTIGTLRTLGTKLSIIHYPQIDRCIFAGAYIPDLFCVK
jgi:hypothetical protein